MSPGPLYQFFPNKDAIAEALASRYLEQLHATQAYSFAPDVVHLPWSSSRRCFHWLSGWIPRSATRWWKSSRRPNADISRRSSAGNASRIDCAGRDGVDDATKAPTVQRVEHLHCPELVRCGSAESSRLDDTELA